MSHLQRLIIQRLAVISARFDRMKEIVKAFRDFRHQKNLKLDAQAQQLQRIVEQLSRRSIAENKNNEDIPEPLTTPPEFDEAMAPKNTELVKCRPRPNARTSLEIRKNRSDQISAANKKIMKMSLIGNSDCLQLPRVCDKLLTELPNSAISLQTLKEYEMCDRFERETRLSNLRNMTKIIADSRPSYINFTSFLCSHGKRMNTFKQKRED